MKFSKKQIRKLHAMGAQVEIGRYHGAKGNAITCQKCGAQSNDPRWFEAHKKTHPDFNKERHYKIAAKFRDNPQSRLREHHELGRHEKYCGDMKGGCQLQHLGKYRNGKN